MDSRLRGVLPERHPRRHGGARRGRLVFAGLVSSAPRRALAVAGRVGGRRHVLWHAAAAVRTARRLSDPLSASRRRERRGRRLPAVDAAVADAVARGSGRGHAGRDRRVHVDRRSEPALRGGGHQLDQTGPRVLELVVGSRQLAGLRQAARVRRLGRRDGLGVQPGRCQLDADGRRRRAATGALRGRTRASGCSCGTTRADRTTS